MKTPAVSIAFALVASSFGENARFPSENNLQLISYHSSHRDFPYRKELVELRAEEHRDLDLRLVTQPLLIVGSIMDVHTVELAPILLPSTLFSWMKVSTPL